MATKAMKNDVREYPLPLSAPMVRAILAGEKTQDRQVAAVRKNCDPLPTHLWNRLVFDAKLVPVGAPQTFADPGGFLRKGGYLHVSTRPHPEDPQDADEWTLNRIYPKWNVGDRLWVKETWGIRGYMWVSRITLEITDIRAQRVQEISEEDAVAEGVQMHCGGYLDYELGPRVMHSVPAVYSFKTLWNSLNAKRGFGWEQNDWAWVRTLKRV